MALSIFNKDFVAFYRKYLIIPTISRVYSRLLGYIPFSVAELLLYLCIIGFAAIIVYFIVKLIRTDKRKAFIKQSAINTGVFISIVFSLFTLNCGVYYYREGIGQYLGYEQSPENYTKEDLYEVCMYLVKQVNEMKPQVDLSKYDNFSYISKGTRASYENLSSDYDVFEGVYGYPKKVMWSRGMSYAGIVGIFIPFTMEANINSDIAGFMKPSAACHEMAHMYGFMKEDEANFISYLACMASDDVNFRYSGAMDALILCENKLFEVDIDLWGKVDDAIDSAVDDDFNENNQYWNDIEDTQIGSSIMDASENINDTYLKANGQDDGVNSYGRMVELMIAMYQNKIQ